MAEKTGPDSSVSVALIIIYTLPPLAPDKRLQVFWQTKHACSGHSLSHSPFTVLLWLVECESFVHIWSARAAEIINDFLIIEY